VSVRPMDYLLILPSPVREQVVSFWRNSLPSSTEVNKPIPISFEIGPIYLLTLHEAKSEHHFFSPTVYCIKVCT
jgi:hypothetical protein